MEVTGESMEVTGGSLQVSSESLEMTGESLELTGESLQVAGGGLEVAGGDLQVARGGLQVSSESEVSPPRRKKKKKISTPLTPGVSTKVIILVRHGDYKEWADTPEDNVLTRCGNLQATGAAKALKVMPGRPGVKEIVHSTMIRAEQTARIMHEKFQDTLLRPDPQLEEGNPDRPHTANRFDRVFSEYFVANQGPSEATQVLVCH